MGAVIFCCFFSTFCLVFLFKEEQGRGRKRKEEQGRGRKRKEEEGRGRKSKEEEGGGGRRRKEEEGRGRKRKEEEGRGRKRKEEEGEGRRRKWGVYFQWFSVPFFFSPRTIFYNFYTFTFFTIKAY